LSGLEIRRYSRLLLPSFGVEAQQKLAKASVLVVGAGGLGSPVLLYLAASGVGCLGIMDLDSVELHNLHRQVIHSEAFVGELKVKSATTTCLAINSSLQVSNQSLQNLAILESCN
jgi:adenylyltransferase/sulfurtransferase